MKKLLLFLASVAVAYGQMVSWTSPTQIQRKPFVDVRDYGAKADGVTNDRIAIQLAINAGGTVYFPSGTYKITTGIIIDTKYANLQFAKGAKIDATSLTSGCAVEVYSTATYGSDEGLKNWGISIDGISLEGDATGTAIGFCIGKVGASYSQSHDIVVQNGAVYGFNEGVHFYDNAWRTRFNHVGFENVRTYFVYFNTPSNAGEVMTFDGCWMTNGVYSAGIYISDGQFHFRGLSFPGGGDDGYIYTLRSALVTFEQCNFETQPQSVDHTILWTKNNSHVVISNSTVLINDAAYTVPYFRVDDGSTLELRGNELPLWGYLGTEATYDVRALVNGNSERVFAFHNVVHGGGLSDGTNWAVVSKAANLVANGNAETTDLRNWFKTGAGTASNVGTSPKEGSRVFKLVSTASNSVQLEQRLDNTRAPGEHIVMGLWVKAVAGSGTLAYSTIRFFDKFGDLITSYAAITVPSTATSWTWRCQSTRIPVGTAVIGIQISADAIAGGAEIHYDDIVVNII